MKFTNKLCSLFRALESNGFHVHATAMQEEFNRWGNEAKAETLIGAIGIAIADPAPVEAPPADAEMPIPAETTSATQAAFAGDAAQTEAHI